MKIKMPHFFIESTAFSVFIIAAFVLWSYKIDGESKERDKLTQMQIIELKESYENNIFQLNKYIQGRWSIDMQEKYNEQVIGHISSPTNLPPNVREIKESIYPSLP